MPIGDQVSFVKSCINIDFDFVTYKLENNRVTT
jgi:hypothetical protein